MNIFANIFKTIASVFKAIFGGKADNGTTVPVQKSNYIKMNDDVKTFLLAGHTDADKKIILNTIAANEEKEIVEYTISLERCYYIIRNGQIIGNGKSEKEAYENLDYVMSNDVKQFLLAGLSDADKESVVKQIAEAESKHLLRYSITYSRGYFIIYGGQIIENGVTNYKGENVAITNGKTMSEAVKSFLLCGLPSDEAAKLRLEIADHEEHGIYEYYLETSRWTFYIKNGQIAGCSTNGAKFNSTRV